MQELKSGDLCVPGSERFGDYRNQLISWQEYEAKAEAYCRQVGISPDPATFVRSMKTWLSDTIPRGTPHSRLYPVIIAITRFSPWRWLS